MALNDSSTSTVMSDSSDTDLDAQFDQKEHDWVKREKTSGLASPQCCMLCGVGLASRK